jgi:hypothetical protein
LLRTGHVPEFRKDATQGVQGFAELVTISEILQRLRAPAQQHGRPAGLIGMSEAAAKLLQCPGLAAQVFYLPR